MALGGLLEEEKKQVRDEQQWSRSSGLANEVIIFDSLAITISIVRN